MNKTIGDRILSIIDHQKLKKVEFARKLNIDQSYVTQLIKGRNNPSDRLVSDICEKFNVSELWLRSGDGEMFIETDDSILCQISNQYNLTNRQQTIISCFLKLNSSQRDAVVDYFSFVADAFNAESNNVDPIEKELTAYREELEAEQKGQSVYENSKKINVAK